jgi:dUTP pyrophosphatase
MQATIPPVLIQRLPNFPATNALPSYQSTGAAGADVQSAEDFHLTAGRSAAIHTGLAFAVPAGYEMQVRSRSGLAAKHAVFVTNGIGTIDCDYRGEVMVLLTNAGKEDLKIKQGDRIAQLVFAPTYRPVAVSLAEELPATDRGVGGLGSTGR